METNQIYKKLFNTILEVGSEATSEKYMVTVLETILKIFYKDYPFLKHITFIHLGGVSISVSDKINSADKEKLEFALSEVMRTIKKPFEKEGENSFGKKIESKLDQETLDELKKIDIKF